MYGSRVTSAPSVSRRAIASSRPPTVIVSVPATLPMLSILALAIVGPVTSRLEELLREAFPDAQEVAVEDRTGGGDHFAGLSLVEQHRLVYDALAAPLADGTIHELRIKTRGDA